VRTLIVGYGNQGKKRAKACGADFISAADPYVPEAGWRQAEDVPCDTYDAVVICTPYYKYDLCEYFLSVGKHILVEKPLWLCSNYDNTPVDLLFDNLERQCKKNKLVLYTGYNHRFEPSIVQIKSWLRYKDCLNCRMYYGNGTAAHVAESWRDVYPGIVAEIGAHLLDLVDFLLDKRPTDFTLVMASADECKTYDNALFVSGSARVSAGVSWTAWKNEFSIDIAHLCGSSHVESLQKWGHSVATHNIRVLPSGVPIQHTESFSGPYDPTWEMEYEHFKRLCGAGYVTEDLKKDLWIQTTVEDMLERWGSMV